MNTTLDCLPCFLKQALFTARLCTSSLNTQRTALQHVAKLLNEIDLSISPPENSINIYRAINKVCNKNDPFEKLKQEGNQIALDMAPDSLKRIQASDDSLFTAILFALAGNIIDYGSHQDFDIDKTVAKSLSNKPVINHYKKFCHDLKKSKTLLYLGDNCGEIVFDRLLIEQLDKEIFFAVKEAPIINDALEEDAVSCGIDKICTVVSNGTDCPGTPIHLCSREFLDIYNSADMIISKGQGNFETLSMEKREIYFLLTVKCPIVGKHISEISGHSKEILTGETVFMKNQA